MNSFFCLSYSSFIVSNKKLWLFICYAVVNLRSICLRQILWVAFRSPFLPSQQSQDRLNGVKDHLVASQPSGSRHFRHALRLVGSNGLGPSTSRLSGVCSNQLSYEPILVEVIGFEPMTPCLQGRCSTSWAIPPPQNKCSPFFQKESSIAIKNE